MKRDETRRFIIAAHDHEPRHPPTSADSRLKFATRVRGRHARRGPPPRGRGPVSPPWSPPTSASPVKRGSAQPAQALVRPSAKRVQGAGPDAIPTRPARQASTPYLRRSTPIRDSRRHRPHVQRWQSRHGARNAEPRTPEAKIPPRQGAARGDPPAARPVCARFPVSTLVPRFWNLIIHRFGAPLVIKPQGATP